MAIEQKEQSASDKTELLPRSPLKLVGPGNGLIILGLTYLVWYVMPFSITFLTTPPDFGRSFHNWAYSMTIFIAGLAWYHKSPLSRIVLVIQAFIVPVSVSGSVVTFDAAMVNWASPSSGCASCWSSASAIRTSSRPACRSERPTG